MNNIADFLLNIPYFWLIITVVLFKVFERVKKVKYFQKIPTIIYTAGVVFFLMTKASVSFEEYNQTANVLTFMLFPATITLAFPLVENFEIIKNNKRAVGLSILFASAVSIVLVVMISEFMDAPNNLLLSMVPKSITTPIAIEVSKHIGGVPSLTVCVVVLTGLFGGLVGHRFLSLFKIKHNLSIGLAIGAASHVLGTSRCIEKKQQQQAAASGLTVVLAATFTAILAPLILGWLKSIFG